VLWPVKGTADLERGVERTDQLGSVGGTDVNPTSTLSLLQAPKKDGWVDDRHLIEMRIE
jgi:hypothetical protein